MLVELSLGGCQSSVEIIVIKGWVDDFVAVILQVGQFDATGNRMPAVKEEDLHASTESLWHLPHKRPSLTVEHRQEDILPLAHHSVPRGGICPSQAP